MPRSKSASPFRKLHVVLSIPNTTISKKQAKLLVEDTVSRLVTRVSKKQKNKKLPNPKKIKSHSSCEPEQNTHNINLDSAADALVDLTNWQAQGPVLETNYATAISNAVDSGLALDQCMNT